MNDNLDWIRTLGINGGVFATVSLSNIELVLKIVLLVITIAWTGVKIIRLLKDGDDKTS